MTNMYRVQAEFHSSQSADELTEILLETLAAQVTYPSAIQLVVFEV